MDVNLTEKFGYQIETDTPNFPAPARQHPISSWCNKRRVSGGSRSSGRFCPWEGDRRPTDGNDVLDKRAPDAEPVPDIEKWFKSRTESVSSMDLDAVKPEVVEGVDRYLTEELPHSFLAKDSDTLSIDIDISDKKMGLSYDPLLHELRSDKLLDVCEKDEFALADFRLDQLDPMPLSPDDMVVAGEILPKNLGCSEGSERNDDCTKEETTEEVCKSSEHEETSSSLRHCGETTNGGLVDSSSQERDICLKDINDEVSNVLPSIELEVKEGWEKEQKFRTQTGGECRITKKRRKIVRRLEKTTARCPNDPYHLDRKDAIMAVVAISTDKISNTTQIVINTGKEEQIYQGKTSELIEATGNFPKLPNLDGSTAWNGIAENGNGDGTTSNQHELVISNALEELGITDDRLQPVTITEQGKVWLCPREDCGRQFTRLYALKGHLLAHYGVRPFKCNFEGCAWAFYSDFKLKRHKETHLKRKDYVCEVADCNRRFTTIYNLLSHKKLHSRPNRMACHVPDCQEKFQTKRALELHMTKSHDQSHAPYACKQEGCGKKYYSSNALTSHQRCHSYKEVDVKCSWPGCGKLFDKPCRLKAHLRSHTGCKPYPCTFQDCHWAFSSSSKLKRHQKKHTNERKFVCDVSSCGKAFMRSEHLREHGLTHKEGRYFRCYACDANFSAKSSLYVHLKKHRATEAAGGTVRTVPARGAARTELTREDVKRLKDDPPDAALAAADLAEELSSLYYQEDLVGAGECQVLLLDPGTSEEPDGLRDLRDLR
ncbi:zinc finger and SCAN domain-containing protein 2 [Orussus abietinus]|uniref:zinc finger and SCAN domain-containing protein 2 n=1 Tax=Orussus abietinus TaxID=222816 RepID=UPI000626EA9C|nr:zinc finger and SCAN domain-containing protein 2 [Orussus abietinus]